jgi:hypothetical protein
MSLVWNIAEIWQPYKFYNDNRPFQLSLWHINWKNTPGICWMEDRGPERCGGKYLSLSWIESWFPSRLAHGLLLLLFWKRLLLVWVPIRIVYIKFAGRNFKDLHIVMYVMVGFDTKFADINYFHAKFRTPSPCSFSFIKLKVKYKFNVVTMLFYNLQMLPR